MPMEVPVSIRIALAAIIVLVLLAIYFKNYHLIGPNYHSLLVVFLSYFLLRSYYSDIYFHEAERYLSIVYPLFILLMVKASSFFKESSNIFLSKAYLISGIYLLTYTIIRAVRNDLIWIIDRVYNT